MPQLCLPCSVLLAEVGLLAQWRLCSVRLVHETAQALRDVFALTLIGTNAPLCASAAQRVSLIRARESEHP